MINPVNTDHAMFIWKSKPDLSYSKKLSRYQNSEIILSLNVTALSNLYMYIRPLQVWYGFEYFLQNCSYIKLLISMFIRMCDVQYWKTNNICNTWKIKKKLKILMTCNDLSFINTTQKTLKPSKKMFQFPGWMRKNFIPVNFSWRVSTETWDASCFKKGLLEKQQSVPNTCNISPLKKIFFQNLIEAFFKYLNIKVY